MQFIKSDTHIDFVGKIKIAISISLAVITIGIVSLIIKGGPNLGVDFTGGTSIRIKFSAPVKISDIKDSFKKINISASSVQQFGEAEDCTYIVRTGDTISTNDNFSNDLKNALDSATGQTSDILSIDMVGPQVGKDLREKALFAIFYSLLFILIYISGRFEFKWVVSAVMAGVLMLAVYVLSIFKASPPILIASALVITIVLCWYLNLKYAMGAIVALIHDVMITVGIFSLFDKEFTLPIIAAILTIIGYSLNDTIIVFDRIRENLKKNYKDPLDVTINKSVNETLSRTIITALTTLIVLIALFFLGGGLIQDFAFAMIIGIVVGTYSSIYIASPILIAWKSKK